MRYEEALQNCIFRYMGGSHAYGTERPDSDEDFRGVFMAPLRAHFDLFKSKFMGHGPINEQLRLAMYECEMENPQGAREMIRKALETDQGDLMIGVETVHKSDGDEELHELRKFLKLAAECNPNIIEFLYVDRLITHETDVWRRIRANRHLFLSRKSRHTFSGYAIAQLRRIQGHRGYLMNPPVKRPERKDFGLPEGSGIPKESQNAILSMQSEYLSDGVRDMVIKEKEYKSVLNDWRSYEKWERERNPKRKAIEAKYGYDCKHACHLVRLIRMAKEILAEGEVHVFRHDRDELRRILNGEWSYERLLAETENMDQELEALYDKSTLQDKPDRKRIDELYHDIASEIYGVKI